MSFINYKALLYLLLLASCSNPKTSESQLRIQNGILDDNRFQGVLPVVHGDRYCSGSLILPNLYLTAQHCVDTSRKGCGVTVLGKEPNECFYDKNYIPGVYTIANARHDLVVLAFSYKKSFVEVPATSLLKIGIPSSYMMRSGDPLTLVGFGDQRTSSNNAGNPIISGHGVGVAGPNSSIQPRSYCQNKIKYVDEDPQSPDYSLVVFSKPENGQTASCLPMPGDSGGPVLWFEAARQRHFIVGTASTVFYPEFGEHRAVYVASINAESILNQAIEWLEKDVLAGLGN